MNKRCSVIRGLVLTILAAVLVGPGAWAQTFEVLHSFGNGDGISPTAGQVFDDRGNLYGVTYIGPGNGCNGEGCGTVYQLKPNSDGTWTETTIHAFDGNDGAFPQTSPIFDSQGNLDGSTWGQGYYPDFVYQLMKGSDGTWTESILHQFAASWEGSDPGELTLDTSGNIYGTTRGGGVLGSGVVFSLNRSSGWQERLLLTFDGFPTDGGISPYGAIAFDADGNLYGTTILGGAYDSGVVYKLTKRGSLFWQETVLYAFTGGSDGNIPLGVVFGPDGSLYGVTEEGGNTEGIYCAAVGCGTVYKLTPNLDGTWTETVLYAFRGLGFGDGAGPTQRITFDEAGNLYSTTDGGGSNICGIFGCPPCGDSCGTVFKLTPSSGGQWTESIIHSFTGHSDGASPSSPLAIDETGNLFGTTLRGGLYGYGVAYEITP